MRVSEAGREPGQVQIHEGRGGQLGAEKPADILLLFFFLGLSRG